MALSFPTSLRYALRLGGLALAAAVLAGCAGVQMSSGNVAMVRAIDASPDIAGMDFYQTRTPVAYSLSFGIKTSYVPVVPGTYALSAYTAGTRQLLVSSNAPLANGHQYTALFANVAAGLQETVLEDQTYPAAPGQIDLRFVNEATAAGRVDVYLVPRAGSLAIAAPVASALDFGSSTGYLSAPEGTYAIMILPAGTTPTSETVPLMNGTQEVYTSGSVHTVVLIDQKTLGSPGVAAIVADDVE